MWFVDFNGWLSSSARQRFRNIHSIEGIHLGIALSGF